MPNTEVLAEHNRLRRTAVTPEEMAALGHLRDECHDGSVCPLCIRNEQLVRQAFTIDALSR